MGGHEGTERVDRHALTAIGVCALLGTIGLSACGSQRAGVTASTTEPQPGETTTATQSCPTIIPGEDATKVKVSALGSLATCDVTGALLDFDTIPGDRDKAAVPNVGGGQPTFDLALVQVEAQFPDDLSGAVGGADRTVIFKGAAPAAALAIIRATGLDVRVKEHSGFTARELSVAVVEVASEAATIYPVGGLLTTPDALRGTIQVTAYMSEDSLRARGLPGTAVSPDEGARRIRAHVRLPGGIALVMRDMVVPPGPSGMSSASSPRPSASGREALVSTHVDDGSMQANISGVLSLERSCLGIRNGSDFTPLVLPDGRFTFDGKVLTAGGRSTALGATFSAGGGFVEGTGVAARNVTLAPGCDATGTLAIIGEL